MATAKENFLRAFNEAFISGDRDVVLASVTDDVQWHLIGMEKIEGKIAFEKAWNRMPTGVNLTIDTIITHGVTAAVEGKMQVGEKNFAFCDTYRFNKFKDGMIKQIHSFIIEEREGI
ncbi:nuclear transport factor 2 family protein [Pseudalkalibacillus hwajinpoensis]|uniref:nuclear transport factor 2 family protein n=1 Tax=Guptibacillus hwajinpoensis TaxID=208199 RepID=UPI001CFCB2E9|nr:nuclear transport factor 2 family protein [Pseudalkalibacillus hwajinpoensis]